MAFLITKTEVENLCRLDSIFRTICPRCGKKMDEYPALSRYANVDICSDCGTDEAFETMGGLIIREGFNDWDLGRSRKN